MSVGLWAWVVAVGVLLSMLAVDLLAHRDDHVVSVREAARWSVVWVALGLGFGAVVWLWLGPQAGGEYLAGYLIEKSLAVDNIFVIALLFSYFGVPREYQHRVLFYGVLGALVLRALLIVGGTALLGRFHWAIYLFGGFLVLTGVRMVWHRHGEVRPERNPVLRAVRRVVPMTPDWHGHQLWVRRSGRWLATPLFGVLVAVETTDVVFAVDSIPAILAVTADPFLVVTSNAFAILGLRALYFVLADLMHRFTYLKVGLSAVLVLVGTKMLVSEMWKAPVWLSLLAILVLVGGSVAASVVRDARQDGSQETRPASIA